MSQGMMRFVYSGLNSRRAECGIERIELADGRTVVIATELVDNPGASVTNAAELAATAVCKQFEIDPAKLVWIEHYPSYPCSICSGLGRRGGRSCLACRGRGKRRELATYDRVTFQMEGSNREWRFVEPEWRSMTPTDWAALGLNPRP